MAVETFPRTTQRSLLDRSLDLSRVNLELVAYLAIVALSIVAHLWGLGTMAMHHDESIHAWSSWRFYTGAGSFTCWNGGVAPSYCYDPVYHGPSLYVLTFISYFLFGDGDAQARLPMAMAGIAMVASCWWLRPYLGRRGALIAAVLLGFSPSLLYYTRFARHDGLMVLWELWMFIGVFRWLDSGRPGWLYLTAASIALAIATHELYYILFFIFGIFVLMRLIAESRFARYLNLGLLIVLGVCLLVMVLNPAIPVGQGLYFGEKAFLVASTLLLAWLCQRLWEPSPLLTTRLQWLWREDRTTLWVALSIIIAIYTVLYTTFFSYPRGFIDGLYAGLAYWLGSQQEYARGDQPWYYYLIQLPLYEPLSVVVGIGMVLTLITLAVRQFVARRQAVRKPEATSPLPSEDAPLDGDGALAATESTADDGKLRLALDLDEEPGTGRAESKLEYPSPVLPAQTPSFNLHLVPLLLVFWFFTAIIVFSWAGEKMPWLVVHMALPGNLLVAWVLGRLLRVVDRVPKGDTAAGEGSPLLPARISIALVPILVVLASIALGVAVWRFAGLAVAPDSAATTQAAQTGVLQGLIPFLLAAGLIFAVLTIGSQIGMRRLLALTALTVAGILGAYMIRATWKVVYEHPDVPVEILIYTQTSPDVPRYVQDVRELAINLTRNRRNSEDVTGGLSMPIILDAGDPSIGGDGSLAWPLQWYLRDFQRIAWRNTTQFRDNPSPQSFEVQLPDGANGLAPVVMLYKPNVTQAVRNVLNESYVQPYGEGGVFNWWFPEGDKCSPQNPGYKRFYYSTWTPAEVLRGGPGGCGRDISAEVQGPFAPLFWPLQSDNWESLKNFVLYRELPYPLVPGSRAMEVWVRKDLIGASAEPAAGTASGSANLRLLAQQALGGTGELAGPTGVVVDAQGNVYVADTNNHRIQVFDAQGTLLRTLGGPTAGAGQDQFYEPRGVAVDAQGNLYVADTWNARIVKYGPNGEWLKSWGSGAQDLGSGRRATITDGTQAGNAAKPLEFFGPRGVAVDAQGNVYVADTGNKRIVVTDNEGNFRYQWGYAGAEPGAFNEPTGVAVDAQGNVYVADTWNGRVQVFQPQDGDQVSPIPTVTWRVSGWRPDTYDDPSIAASPDGRVYVSVPQQNAVVAANLRGDITLRWGGPGDDLASLSSPSGMALGPNGTIYVVDREKGRVLRFVLPQLRQ